MRVQQLTNIRFLRMSVALKTPFIKAFPRISQARVLGLGIAKMFGMVFPLTDWFL
jgi:hypothetical protein